MDTPQIWLSDFVARLSPALEKIQRRLAQNYNNTTHRALLAAYFVCNYECPGATAAGRTGVQTTCDLLRDL
jgi:hypothetical protein